MKLSSLFNYSRLLRSCSCVGILAAASLGFPYATSPAHSQVIPDNTLPNNSTVLNLGPFQVINGGTTVTNGNNQNLFHSFEQFSIPAGNFTLFNNAATVNNIIARVTQASSSIDGILAANGTANLFLINPHGIQFGENALVAIGGAFFASTADRVLFENNQFFSASDTTTSPLLTISAPIGLQLGTNPGSITSQAIIGSNQTVGLVGGEVVLDGGALVSVNSRIELLAAADGTVSLVEQDGQLALETQPTVGEWRDITLQNGAQVLTEGDGSGAIQIQGKRVSIREGSIVRSNNTGSEAGGDTLVYASEQVEVTGTNSDGDFSLLETSVDDDATGAGGNVTIRTPRLVVSEGGRIEAETEGAGAAGNLTIQAQVVEINGESAAGDVVSLLSTEVDDNATGQGGTLTIEAEQVLILDGAVVEADTEAPGDAGAVIIRAQELTLAGESMNGRASLLSTETQAETSGNGGDVVIQVDRLVVRDGAQIDASTLGEGNAGNIIITADEVELSGQSSQGDVSQISTVVSEAASGNAGRITLTVNSLSLNDQAQLSSATEGGGNAGEILVQAQDTLALNSGARITSGTTTTATGNGGNVAVQTGILNLTDAQITASTQSVGAGGNINIEAQTIDISGQDAFGVRSGLTAAVEEGASGQGGEITVHAEQLTLSNLGEITTSTAGQNNAGNIDINVLGTSALSSGARITSGTTTTATGNGGNVAVQTGILNLTDAQITASTQSVGAGGNINIEAQTIDISGQDAFGVRSGLTAAVEEGASGQGGEITVQAEQLTLSNLGEITTSTAGQNNAGNIDINVLDTSALSSGARITSGTTTTATGNGGNVAVQTGILNLTDAQITASTQSVGAGGNIDIEAQTIDISGQDAFGVRSGLTAAVEEGASGQGGEITIQADRLTLSNLGEITTSTAGQNNAGNIDINVLHTSTLSSGARITSGATTTATGDGGNVAVQTGTLTLTDSQITASTQSVGAGGNIDIEAQTIDISGQDALGVRSGLTAAVEEGASGQGGEITVQAEQLTLSNLGEITTSTAGQNNAGNIDINVLHTSALNSGARITSGATTTATGNGGNVAVQTGTLNLTDAQITVSNESTAGQAGAVSLTTQKTLQATRSQITATTASGDGGNLTLNVGNILFLEDNSLISTTAGQAGAGGMVVILRSRLLFCWGTRTAILLPMHLQVTVAIFRSLPTPFSASKPDLN